MPEIEIRPISPADVSILAGLDHGNRTDYVWQMDRVIEEGQMSIRFREVRLPRSIRIEYPYPTGPFADTWKDLSGKLVAVLDGLPVGYIGVEDGLETQTAWVANLVVSEKVRRDGIGSALVLTAGDWAVRRGMRKMMLEMNSKNFPAIKMALKLGFEFSGYHDQYYANRDIAFFYSRLLK